MEPATIIRDCDNKICSLTYDIFFSPKVQKVRFYCFYAFAGISPLQKLEEISCFNVSWYFPSLTSPYSTMWRKNVIWTFRGRRISSRETPSFAARLLSVHVSLQLNRYAMRIPQISNSGIQNQRTEDKYQRIRIFGETPYEPSDVAKFPVIKLGSSKTLVVIYLPAPYKELYLQFNLKYLKISGKKYS